MNFHRFLNLMLLFSLTLFIAACEGDDTGTDDNNGPSTPGSVVFMLIDEDSIDNGNPPNNFSETDVNDQIATVGLRVPLQYFAQNVGQEIYLYTGQVGDEGWFAPKAILESWINTGPTGNGTQNFLVAGPGLGSETGSVEREAYLDEVPNIIPLRATGLAMLKGKTVLAVVYDSDISINYSPIKANLKGENLGMVAFDVLDVEPRLYGSTSDLPRVKIKIRSVAEVSQQALHLFSNVPMPSSSSTPMDVSPPATVPASVLITAP